MSTKYGYKIIPPLSNEIIHSHSHYVTPPSTYENVSLIIDPGIIPQINNHILNSLFDFYGVFLGTHIIDTNNKNSTNSNINSTQNITIFIQDVILILKKEYISSKLNSLFQRIINYYKQYSIIGILTAKAFSYPNLSLRDMEFYKNANHFYTNADFVKKSFPLLIGAFSHNKTIHEQMPITSFESKFYYYDTENKLYKSIPYKILNLKETGYNKFEKGLVKVKGGIRVKEENGGEREVEFLKKEILNSHLKSINEEYMNILTEMKKNLKTHMKEYLKHRQQIYEYLK